MKIKDCIAPGVRTVNQSETLQRAAQIMREAEVGFLPVVNLAGTPMGVITDRDIAIRVVADGVPLNEQVYEAMSDHVHKIDQDAAVEEAVGLMKEKNVGRLVVTDSLYHVVGVISLGDAAIALNDEPAGHAVMDAVARHSHAPAIHPPAHLIL